MSGIAIEAETMPGRQATFVTCSRHGSSRIDSSSFSEANTRPDTRMAPERGSSHSESVIRTRLIGRSAYPGWMVQRGTAVDTPGIQATRVDSIPSLPLALNPETQMFLGPLILSV